MNRITNIFRSFSIILLMISSLLFSSCSLDSASEIKDSIDLKDFKSGDAYCYKGLDWGISKEDVEKNLSISLHDIGAFKYETEDNEVSLFGYKGIQSFEFINNELTTVYFIFADEKGNLQELLDKTVGKFKENYGEHDDLLEMQTHEGEIYRWINYNDDKTSTSLQVQGTGKKNSIEQVMIAVTFMDSLYE